MKPGKQTPDSMEIRQAEAPDYPLILDLLKSLKLPVEGVQEHLENFWVLSLGGKLSGVVGLEVYGRKALLRSLAVERSLQGKGYGTRLYRAILEQARKRRIREVYLLTETAEAFFSARGFEKISRDLVDEAVKTSVEFSTACPASAACMWMRLE